MKARFELAEGLLATYQIMDLRTGVKSCVHCNHIWATEPDEEHEDDCLVLVAREVVAEENEHGW